MRPAAAAAYFCQFIEMMELFLYLPAVARVGSGAGANVIPVIFPRS
jgi:hypothetical protein